jgi:tRNA 2-thiouridine synthesizing protein A
MKLMENTGFNIKDRIDVTEEICPMTYVKTKLKLETLNNGECLEVILPKGEALKNVPMSLKDDGHNILLIEKYGDNYRLIVERRE